MNAELALDEVRLFLERLSVGSTDKAFLIDQEGRLIATSTGLSVTDVNNYPLLASDSADRHIATSAKHIEAELKRFRGESSPAVDYTFVIVKVLCLQIIFLLEHT